MKFYVIRHGQTETNKNKGMVGRKQVYSLTEKGVQQAEEASKLVEELDYDIVICSPLERAEVTCNIVNTKNKPVIKDDRLMERDCGIMEGQPKENFDYPHYWNYNYDFNIEGMISIKDFAREVWECLDEIKETYSPETKILIVTHNGVCRMIGAYFNGIPEDGNLSVYAHDNCEIKSYEAKIRDRSLEDEER